MKKEILIKYPRKPHFWEAMFSFVALVVVMAIGIAVFKVDPHIPMFIGVMIAALMALRIGYKWSQIEEMMITGITRSMQAILILCVVGMMVGIWILSGTIPTMIYYGLKLLSPTIFLPATVLVCSVCSLATGTSWGTIGTMGLALMGIAQGMGMPLGPTAGAILAGAYFGDKLSPLSDTTNLAPAMAGTDVFTHVKYMLKATLIAFVIALAFYAIYGMKFASGDGVDTSQIEALMVGITTTFNVNPILMLPPVVVILAITLKVPALPGITIGALVGAVLAPIFQSELGIFGSDMQLAHVGVNFGDILYAAKEGFICNTDLPALNDLLTSGGLMNMASSILMTILAMMFGGIMEFTNQLEVIVDKILAKVKSGPGLIAATEATCIASNVTMPEQYISLLIPGRMYAEAYKKAGIHPKSLSNALESGGTVTSPLIPWNTCGIYIATTLGVTAGVYAPWAVFNWLMPIVTLGLAFVGVTCTKMTPDEQERALKGQMI